MVTERVKFVPVTERASVQLQPEHDAPEFSAPQTLFGL